jgi:hypothetical protein
MAVKGKRGGERGSVYNGFHRFSPGSDANVITGLEREREREREPGTTLAKCGTVVELLQERWWNCGACS